MPNFISEEQIERALVQKLQHKEHYRVVSENGLFVIRDLKSRNGTFINSQTTSIEEHVLSDGDLIAAGDLLFVFTYGASDK